MKIEFLEHSLRSSLKSMEPTPSSMFFLEPEFVELDVFGMKIWKQSWNSWSGAVPNRPILYKSV